MHSEPVNVIDEYIAGFPAEVRDILTRMREVIHAAAPQATEKMAYGIPTFVLHGNLVHFAAFREHIGFYPSSSGIEHFKAALAGYSTSRGTVRFPLDRPIPYDLVREIVLFRVQENTARAEMKRAARRT